MRTLIASAVSGLLLVAASALDAQEQKAAAAQPAAVTITADVIDLSCRLVNKASGASHAEHRVRVKGRVIEQGAFKAIVIETIEM